MHFHALKQCLAHGVDLVTPSYPCPQFLKLGKEAAARGITVICEQGCDPGIDHMLAMEYIDRLHAQGGKVREKSALIGHCLCIMCSCSHTAATACSYMACLYKVL